MAKIEITKTELVWPGKYNEDGTLKEVPRVSLPFQVIERVNESRATREARRSQTPSLFDIYEGNEGDTFEEGWRNKLIWGDNLLVMSSLLEKFAGKIDLIYIDPPFATGADFSFTATIGEEDEEVKKEQSIIEEKAYRDTWGGGLGTYLQMMYERLVLIRELLSDQGSLYVHCDYRVNSHIRLILDEVFGEKQMINQIIWQKVRSSKAQSKSFGNVSDIILFYSKSTNSIFNRTYVPLNPARLRTHYKYIEEGTGRRYQLCDFTQKGPGPARRFGEMGWLEPPPGKHWIWTQEKIDQAMKEGRIVFTSGKMPRLKRYLDEVQGNPIEDIWTDIAPINSMASERVDYATQKPEALLERIILASSNPGSLVADFFCGSGTTLAVAEELGRRWIGCDLSRWAIHVTRKRLLDIPNCKPFEVLNLGKYERQYWQGVTFGDKKDKAQTEQALYAYLAFILKLYGAQPVPGVTHLHGKKGKAMVHIGAVDAPVTIDEIMQALDECVSLKQTELHVLGWEWEMGLAGPNEKKGGILHDTAKQKGVKLVLLQIPREVMEQQAVDKNDIKFYELAYFDVGITHPKPRTVQLELTDFASPNMHELVPEEVRCKISKWSDYIDYWAVDWNFQNDTFVQGWVAYRTRKRRTLPLQSDPHTYDQPGTYRILVKVIDIFGNDTSRVFEVEVK